ncbi:hypothetical protein JMJ35_006330 [Cladonia borealis]|uniref:Uncharacterized protein n=1 Tax=Cladonia borealis TaxID=184061 RepID=A0AA39QYT7_9LECA|nr:hypothetical protein JMJ35_006330 [Cladonia borealis]
MPAVRIRESVAPTYLSNFRILQIIMAVIYLILICYAGVHHGYWNSLVQPLGFGISTSLATILVSIPSILKQSITTKTAVRGHFIHFLRIISEFIMMALWIASFITMLLPKGKDFRVLFDKPPHIVWGVAIAIAILEAMSFVWSLVLQLRRRYHWLEFITPSEWFWKP